MHEGGEEDGGGEGPWARVGIGIPGGRVISAWWMGRYLHG